MHLCYDSIVVGATNMARGNSVNNILTAQVVIKGTRPLWWHHFGADALPLEKGEKTGVAGNDPQEWRRTVLVNKDGQLFLEPTYLFGTITNGGRFIPKKRGTIMLDIAATLQVADDCIFVDRWFPGFPNGHVFDIKSVVAPPNVPDLPVYLDVRGVRNPVTKGRNIRYRVAASPGWTISFTIQWDKTVVQRDQLHSAIIQAGMLVGLGSGRSIGMGRFTVESFQVSES